MASLLPSIDLFIVENHDEVLAPLYRKIGSKTLPYEGMLMLHLDSHSDLSVPKDLVANQDGTLLKQDVFGHASIESWIIPTLYSGHIDSVVWLHPNWTKHSFQDESRFKVGKCAKTNTLKVTSTSNHFLSEDSFEHIENLKYLREVQLLVQGIDPSLVFFESAAKLKDTIRDHKDSFILDIDLDFFSTKDPFLEMLGPELYNSMNQAYAFTPPKTLDHGNVDKCILARKHQLSQLKEFWTSQLDSHKTDQGICFFSDEVLKVATLKMGHDLMWLHEVGTGMDDCPLPHHISSENEIDQLIYYLEELLSMLPAPSVIFVARSSEDDYCPAEQVDMIQTKVTEMLERLYKGVKKTLLYEK